MPETSLAGVKAQTANRDAGLENSVSAGVSVGTIGGRDAAYWGLSIDYTRVLNDKWSFSASIAFDQETEEFPDAPDVLTDSYTAIAVFTYALSERWSIGGGFGKSFLNDANAERKLEFINGDLSTGIAFGYRLADSIGASFNAEYNIDQREPSISVDLTYTWSF